MYVCMYVCICMYVCMYVYYIYMCVCACMYVCVLCVLCAYMEARTEMYINYTFLRPDFPFDSNSNV